MLQHGLSHIWSQGDFVTRGIFVVLVVMALLTWTVIAVKLMNMTRLKWLTRNAAGSPWQPADFEASVDSLDSASPSGPANLLIALALSGKEAVEHHRQTQPQLRDRMDISDWVTRCLKDTMDDIVARLQSGLTILASIGSTAPFVGLFGTVWGIYHALIAISLTGDGTIDHVAGPVGESLIMTALGLFVAIPAVLGYNALTCANKDIVRKLSRFAHGLHAYFVMGSYPASRHDTKVLTTDADVDATDDGTLRLQ